MATSLTTTSAARDLDRLDAALLATHQWFRRPGQRRRIWELLSMQVELTTVRVLRAVETAPAHGPTIGDLASALGVAPSTASRFVDRVVERGELVRVACRNDARRTRVTLTDKGRQTLEAVTRARRSILSERTEGWSDDDIEQLTVLLERLGQRFDELEARR